MERLSKSREFISNSAENQIRMNRKSIRWAPDSRDPLSRLTRPKSVNSLTGLHAPLVHRASRANAETQARKVRWDRRASAASEGFVDFRGQQGRPDLEARWARRDHAARMESGARERRDHEETQALVARKVHKAHRERLGRKDHAAQKGLAALLARRVQSARWAHKVG